MSVSPNNSVAAVHMLGFFLYLSLFWFVFVVLIMLVVRFQCAPNSEIFPLLCRFNSMGGSPGDVSE